MILSGFCFWINGPFLLMSWLYYILSLNVKRSHDPRSFNSLYFAKHQKQVEWNQRKYWQQEYLVTMRIWVLFCPRGLGGEVMKNCFEETVIESQYNLKVLYLWLKTLVLHRAWYKYLITVKCRNQLLTTFWFRTGLQDTCSHKGIWEEKLPVVASHNKKVLRGIPLDRTCDRTGVTPRKDMGPDAGVPPEGTWDQRLGKDLRPDTGVPPC